MKNIALYLLITAIGYLPEANIAEITKALSEGNTSTLSRYFDDAVEVGILEKEDVYNSSQASKILGDFFKQYPPKSYAQVHQGSSKSKDSIYCIGNLATDNGTFRVYIYMRVNGKQHLIQELRLDKE